MEVRKMHFGYSFYPYTISNLRREERNKPRQIPVQMEHIITKHMSIAEEIQRRLSIIDERIERMEKIVQERMRRNP
jgi:hypothetical protein